MDHAFGKDTGIWAESTEKWDEAHPSWKIVGHDPRRLLKSEVCLDNNGIYHRELIEDDLFNKSSIEHIFEYDGILYSGSFDECSNKIVESIQYGKEDIIYLVVYTSGKICLAVSKFIVEVGSYVIIEADRGEDCVQVKEQGKIIGGEVIKRVLRKATQRDIEILEKKKILEVKAMEKCNILVKEKGLPMGITGCEFQWDMKKITFYFKSEKRVDFRELVNDLFKYFKVRIWMSMENRR